MMLAQWTDSSVLFELLVPDGLLAVRALDPSAFRDVEFFAN